MMWAKIDNKKRMLFTKNNDFALCDLIEDV